MKKKIYLDIEFDKTEKWNKGEWKISLGSDGSNILAEGRSLILSENEDGSPNEIRIEIDHRQDFISESLINDLIFHAMNGDFK